MTRTRNIVSALLLIVGSVGLIGTTRLYPNDPWHTVLFIVALLVAGWFYEPAKASSEAAVCPRCGTSDLEWLRSSCSERGYLCLRCGKLFVVESRKSVGGQLPPDPPPNVTVKKGMG